MRDYTRSELFIIFIEISLNALALFVESSTKISRIFVSSISLDFLKYFLIFWPFCRWKAVTGVVLCKKVFLEISQNSHENTCARI